ncbi:MAG: HEAT repeat domain-containing protein [Candidatus Latescibacterota bacterium]|nr:HEAT repeat domain-containing protein [Candidatus Latescibacterota bacterium]
MTEPILLTDEQMREFIVNGYLVFTPSVPEGIHETCYRKLNEIIDSEDNPGNNILPRVPEMRHVLNSREVRGALISVLGPDHLEHPHRYCHPIKPAKEVLSPDEVTEKLRKNCHQDGYTPLGHPRQHYLRYARIMYYPQDSPVELGPTHVIPGTQFNRGLTDEDRARAVPVAGQAGTVSLTHFDVGHAAGVSQLKRHRHMIKFIYVRSAEPTEPTWDCKSTDWLKPENITAPYDLELAWAHSWDWSCGKRDRYESWPQTEAADIDALIAQLGAGDLDPRLRAAQRLAEFRSAAANAVPRLVASLGTDHQAMRTAAIYALGAIGEAAVDALVQSLCKAGQIMDKAEQSPWNEGATNMEDAAQALAAIGDPAVGALRELLSDDSEWIRVNAAFALGEMDSHAAAAVPDLVARLDDDSHKVVRTAIDALGSIATGVPVDQVGRMLEADHPDWHEQMSRRWIPRDQVRTNAATVCARLGRASAPLETDLLRALDDPCGHVGSFALNALQRIGSPAARQAAMDYLCSQRWDASIDGGRQF